VAVAIGILGFATTLATIVFSLMPAADKPHPGLAVAKIIGLTALLLGMGIAIFAWESRTQKMRAEPRTGIENNLGLS